MLVHEEAPFNAEPTSAALAASYLTPTDTFYSRNHGPIPTLDPATWRLEVDGLVDRTLRLSLQELKDSFEEHEVTATVQCAGNRRAGLIAVRDIPGEDPWQDGATSTAIWAGIRLTDVLAAAGVTQDDAAADELHVAFQAPDVSELARPSQAYGGSIPLTKATRPEVLLAWSMNGEALAPVHGAPLRVVVPGWIGARSVKWLERVTVRHGPSDNYFQSVAYRLLPPDADPDAAGPGDGLSLGPIALNSAILSPCPSQHGQRRHCGGRRVRLRRRRTSCRAGRRVVRRGPDLGAGRPGPRPRALGMAVVACRGPRHRRGRRARRPSLGRHCRCPALGGRTALEPQGIRQQLLPPSDGARRRRLS
ncbi:molybdopterin-dependent oxidoreductase [Allobranchiibius sp. GilTou73]|nr:molybdopterin-dependent oxidoreductase [Allobranchiibius sp. GilTou73]UIJ35957.1 molybdopterin-dependent oxidoreductase [Allobranchiibius sp. GilTou73]